MGSTPQSCCLSESCTSESRGRNWSLGSKRTRQQLLLYQSLGGKSLPCVWGQTQRWREEVRNFGTESCFLQFTVHLLWSAGTVLLCQCILWILPLNFRNRGVNLGCRTSWGKYLMWLCSCKWRLSCVSETFQSDRSNWRTFPIRGQSMPTLLLPLELFLACMVYTTYVIMNYLFILYGSLAESTDALHS